jgi:hypothetical protein
MLKAVSWTLTLALLPSVFLVAPVTAASRLRCQIEGTRMPEYVPGTSRGEVICGRGGGDTIVGYAGRDTIRGGWGGDRIFAGDEREDWIDGRSGRDICFVDKGLDHFQDCEIVRRS